MPGGCAFYRSYLPMKTIDQAVTCRFGLPAFEGDAGFGVRAGDHEAVFGFDTAVVKLLMERNVPQQIRMAQSVGQRVVLDVDDFYDDLPPENVAHRLTSAENSRLVNRDHYRAAILAADTVTVTTPFLKTHYSRVHPDVRMVRNGILPGMFKPRKVRERRPVVGWVGGIPWRGRDLETLREWLPGFLEDHDLMFHHAGATGAYGGRTFAELSGINEARVTSSPLRLINEYPSMFQFDIGIIPLDDTDFNRAKSCLKGLEYSAAGIPFVAQGLPEYQRLSDAGVGRVAHTPDDWVRHMSALLDFGARKKDARVNLDRVTREHSIQARAGEWQAVLLE